jgi:hypothetical protein
MTQICEANENVEAQAARGHGASSELETPTPTLRALDRVQPSLFEIQSAVDDSRRQLRSTTDFLATLRHAAP